MDQALPFTEVAGGLLPPTRQDRIFRAKVWFECGGGGVPPWDVTRVVNIHASMTPREVVEQQIGLVANLFNLTLDSEDYVLQANEAPGVVLESVECPDQKLVDYPWMTTKLVCEKDIELRLTRAEGSVAWKSSRQMANLGQPWRRCKQQALQGEEGEPMVQEVDRARYAAHTCLPGNKQVDVEAVKDALEDAFAGLRGMVLTLDEKASQSLTQMAFKVASLEAKATRLVRERDGNTPLPDSPMAASSTDSAGGPRLFEAGVSSLPATRSALEYKRKHDVLEQVVESQKLREQALQARLHNTRGMEAWSRQFEQHVDGHLCKLESHLADYVEYTSERVALMEEASASASASASAAAPAGPSFGHAHPTPLATPRSIGSPVGSYAKHRYTDVSAGFPGTPERQAGAPRPQPQQQQQHGSPYSSSKHADASTDARMHADAATDVTGMPSPLNGSRRRGGKRPVQAAQASHARGAAHKGAVQGKVRAPPQRASSPGRVGAGAGAGAGGDDARAFDRVSTSLTELQNDVVLEQSYLALLTKDAYLDQRDGKPSSRSVELYDEFYKLVNSSPERYVQRGVACSTRSASHHTILQTNFAQGMPWV